MPRWSMLLCGATCWLVFVAGRVSAADADAAPDAAAALAARIDSLIFQRLADEKIEAAPRADDATFLRRIALDISGRIPAVADLHEFLDDSAPDKKRRAVDRLLDGPGYVMHFSNFWRTVMLPEAAVNIEVRPLVPAFEAWLRKRLAGDAPYDALVRELLTVNVDPRNAQNPLAAANELSPVGFYQTKELKPENLAAGTARMFLGVRLECAQCHDHPFDDWKRDQFWSYAAFFASLDRLGRGNQGDVEAIREEFDRREIEIPGTGKRVTPTYLNGERPQLALHASARATLADWMTQPDNPYFAKTVVNRLWGKFFGTGIVHPIDDFTAGNPPSHPELLDLLAREFAAQHFDLKFLIRAITASQAYQRSSEQTQPGQDNVHLFAKMSLKGLSPEQLFDSISQATGYFEPYGSRDATAMMGNGPRDEFLQLFDNSRDEIAEHQTTILQALAMMNGQFVADATSLDKSATLAAVAEFPQMTTGERLEALYLAALSRPPRPDELARLTKHVESAGSASDSKRALADVFWALLNSSEFLFNR